MTSPPDVSPLPPPLPPPAAPLAADAPAFLRHRRVLLAARIMAGVVTVIALYFAAYFSLFNRNHFAYSPDGHPIFCSCCVLAGEYTGTSGAVTAAPMRASVLNYVFLPLDRLTCEPRLVAFTDGERRLSQRATLSDLARW
jgi:hypothetical protein